MQKSKSDVFNFSGIVLFFGIIVFSFIGCATTTPYSFTEQDNNSASISFSGGSPGVTFVSFEDRELPAPEKGTWDPILFPADSALDITVHAYYKVRSTATGLIPMLIADAVSDSMNVNVNTNVLFKCPSLEAGKKYELEFQKEYGPNGRNFLALIDLENKKIVISQKFDTKWE